MNKLFIFIFLMTSGGLVAQQIVVDSTAAAEPPMQTFLQEPVHSTVHGVLLLEGTAIGPARKTNLLIGGQVAWVLNKKYLLGFGITGLSTDVKAPKIFPIEGLNLVCNYGGLILGYIHNSRRLVHLEGQALFGAGQAFYRDDEYKARYDQNDIFLVVEPSCNAVLNVTSGFRLTAGLSYRIAGRVNLIGLDATDLSGLSFNLGFKVGAF